MLSKKQVRALLEVMAPDDIRPPLAHAVLQVYKDQAYLVATDSYKLAAITMEEVVSDEFKAKLNWSISRDALTRWYKLAAPRDYLDYEEILAMAIDRTDQWQYPKWEQILEKSEEESHTVTHIGFNATYALTLQSLADTFLHYNLSHYLSPMVARTPNGSIFLLMPLRD